MFYAMYVFSDKYVKILQLRENIRLLEGEIKILKSENEKLSKEIDWLNQEKSIEKIAREKLGLTKPNEILIKGIEE